MHNAIGAVLHGASVSVELSGLAGSASKTMHFLVSEVSSILVSLNVNLDPSAQTRTALSQALSVQVTWESFFKSTWIVLEVATERKH